MTELVRISPTCYILGEFACVKTEDGPWVILNKAGEVLEAEEDQDVIDHLMMEYALGPSV